jgi:CheY-like chemotaxis protein
MMLLTGKSIFIVEDNLENRTVFQMTLLRSGASIDFERRGQDTIKRLSNLPCVDLIILDLQLAEGLSGFDLYDDIRAMSAYKDVPIVAVSAMDASVAVPKARAMGFSGFITKPIDKHLFPQQISEIFDGKQVWYVGDRDRTT